MDARIVKSAFAKMVDHADAINQHCDGIAQLCGEILTQITRVQDYTRVFRSQLTDTLKEYQREESPHPIAELKELMGDKLAS